MGQKPETVQRYLMDERIVQIACTRLSSEAKLAGAAVAIYTGESRQSVIDRASRVLRIPPEAITRGLSELVQANVIAPQTTGKPEAGYYVLDARRWRIPGESRTAVRRERRR